MNHESLAISKRSFLKALANGALATGLLGPRSSKGAMTYKPRPQALLTAALSHLYIRVRACVYIYIYIAYLHSLLLFLLPLAVEGTQAIIPPAALEPRQPARSLVRERPTLLL